LDGEECDRIKAQLQNVRFQSQDNRQYIAALRLLVKGASKEEDLLAAFAPNNRLLHQDYAGNNSLEFFLASRERRDTVSEQEMVEWARNANTNDKKQAVREYLGLGERKQAFANALRNAIAQTWMENDPGIQEILKVNSHLQQVERAIKGEIYWAELNNSLPNENDDGSDEGITLEPEPPSAEKILRNICNWWKANHAIEVRKYNDRLYPIGIDELKQKLQDRDRSAWLMLFFLGATHMMGRTKHEQHRNFVQFCLNQGWWQTFSAQNPCRHPDEWMGVLNDYMESQSGDTEWYFWMEKFPTIYRIAYYLDAYIHSFLSIDKINKQFDLHQIIAPRSNPAFQGGGPDAAPMRLGIGVNFVVRELVRFGIVELNDYIVPHCFVPRANVRRLLSHLGCYGLRDSDYKPGLFHSILFALNFSRG